MRVTGSSGVGATHVGVTGGSPMLRCHDWEEAALSQKESTHTHTPTPVNPALQAIYKRYFMALHFFNHH